MKWQTRDKLRVHNTLGKTERWKSPSSTSSLTVTALPAIQHTKFRPSPLFILHTCSTLFDGFQFHYLFMQ